MSKRPFRPPFPWVRVCLTVAFAGGIAGGLYGCMVHMPGQSARPPLPPLTAEEGAAAARMGKDLDALAVGIGERNTLRPDALERSAVWIEERLREAGHTPVRHTYEVDRVPCSNIEVDVAGKAGETVVVGAHYDSARGSPGANDNGTGVVALLEIARRLRGMRPSRGVALVFFVNEEPPYFATEKMGSRVWAREAHERGARILGMLSLETMGFYTDAPDSQHYPFPMGAFYPGEGNFLGFIGDTDSGGLVREVVGAFRESASLPSEGAALPGHTPGVDWSDHASFWRYGWPAVMVTDTAPFRYRHYHTREDTPDKVGMESLARAVTGIEKVVRTMAGGE